MLKDKFSFHPALQEEKRSQKVARKSFGKFANFLGGLLAWLVVCLPIIAAFSNENLHNGMEKMPGKNRANAEMQVKVWQQTANLENEQEAQVSAKEAIEKFAAVRPKSRYAKWAFDVLQARRRCKGGCAKIQRGIAHQPSQASAMGQRVGQNSEELITPQKEWQTNFKSQIQINSIEEESEEEKEAKVLESQTFAGPEIAAASSQKHGRAPGNLAATTEASSSKFDEEEANKERSNQKLETLVRTAAALRNDEFNLTQTLAAGASIHGPNLREQMLSVVRTVDGEQWKSKYRKIEEFHQIAYHQHNREPTTPVAELMRLQQNYKNASGASKMSTRSRKTMKDSEDAESDEQSRLTINNRAPGPVQPMAKGERNTIDECEGKEQSQPNEAPIGVGDRHGVGEPKRDNRLRTGAHSNNSGNRNGVEMPAGEIRPRTEAAEENKEGRYGVGVPMCNDRPRTDPTEESGNDRYGVEGPPSTNRLRTASQKSESNRRYT